MLRFFTFTIVTLGLLLLVIQDSHPQTTYSNFEDIYQKDSKQKSWGEIYSSLFKRNDFNKSYALVIGIGEYKKGWPRLESPYYDAIRVRDFLIKEADFDYVVTLTNEKATKEKINTLMEETFPKLLGKKDRFIFYYSGHGTQRKIDGTPLGYLPLANSGKETYGNMISMKEIERWDDVIRPTKHVLFILDCCFSGLAGQQPKSVIEDKRLERLSQYSHFLITAGTENEKSIASLSKWQGSLFTDSFLKAIKGRADLTSIDFEADGVVTLKELMKYIEDCIDKESFILDKKTIFGGVAKMSPQISELQNNYGEFFFIGNNLKYKLAEHIDFDRFRTEGIIEKKGTELSKQLDLEKVDAKMIEKNILKGRMKYERILSDWERSTSENPLVRIKTIIPYLGFSWSGGKIPAISKLKGDWIISLKPGIQRLLINAPNFGSIDIKLNLRKFEVQTYRIVPEIVRYFLRIETIPDTALIYLKYMNGDMVIQGRSPLEFNPTPGVYQLNITGSKYNDIDTTIVINDNPVTLLKFNLKEKPIVQNTEMPSENLPRLAVNVEHSALDIFKLDEIEFSKIKSHIITYLKNSRKLHFVQKNIIDTTNIDYLLKCEVSKIYENSIEPELSLIRVNMELETYDKKIIKIVSFADRIKDYFPSKIDTSLVLIENAIKKDKRFDFKKFILSEKGFIIIATFAISSWIVFDLFFKPSRKY